MESVITASQRNMNVRLNNSKKSAVLLQDSKIIHASDCYNISFCSLILWYSGGYMYGMKEMVHMSRVDMWGNAAGGCDILRLASLTVYDDYKFQK